MVSGLSRRIAPVRVASVILSTWPLQPFQRRVQHLPNLIVVGIKMKVQVRDGRHRLVPILDIGAYLLGVVTNGVLQAAEAFDLAWSIRAL